MGRTFWIAVVLTMLAASQVNAQDNVVTFDGIAQPVTLSGTSNGVPDGDVNVTNDAVSEAVAVRCVNAAGAAFVECGIGGAGTTDTDDGSIAGGQSVGLGAALANVWSGAAWVRLTQGQATMAASIPVTIASNQSTLLVGDGAGALNVICDSGCTPGGSFSDNTAFTFGTTAINVSGGVLDDTAPNAATENSAAAPRISANRMFLMQLGDGAGNERRANVNANNQLLTFPEIDHASTTTGTLTAAGQTVSAAVGGRGVVTFEITGTWVAALEFEGDTGDGGFSNITVVPPNTGTPITGTSTNGKFSAAIGGLTNVRVRASGFTSGTVNVRIYQTHIGSPAVIATAVRDGQIKVFDGVDTAQVSAVGGGSLQVEVTSFPDNELFNLNQIGGNAVSTGVGASGTGTQRTAALIHDGVDTAQVTAVGGGSLQVECTAGCPVSGTEYTDGSATFTQESAPVAAPSGFIFDDVIGVALAENDIAAARITAARAVVTRLEGATRGTYATLTSTSLDANVALINGVTPLMGNGVTGTGSARVTIASDNTAFSVNPLSATAPVSTMDSASANNGLNSALAGVFDDTAPTAITENNFGFLRMSANRNLFGTIRDAAGNERGVNVTAGNALVVDGSASTQPISGTVTVGTFPDNEPINVAQMNGVAVTMGNGISGTGVQRVTLASDSTGQVAVASLPNEGQQTAANSISVTPDTDNDAIGATAAAVPGEAIQVGGTDGTNLVAFYVDPCQREARTTFVVNIATATTTQIAAAVASEFYFICSIVIQTDAANDVAFVEDDTSACASPTAGLAGGTTAATGFNIVAGSGIVMPAAGQYHMRTAVANRFICLITSAATQLTGTITYVSNTTP